MVFAKACELRVTPPKGFNLAKQHTLVVLNLTDNCLSYSATITADIFFAWVEVRQALEALGWLASGVCKTIDSLMEEKGIRIHTEVKYHNHPLI